MLTVLTECIFYFIPVATILTILYILNTCICIYTCIYIYMFMYKLSRKQEHMQVNRYEVVALVLAHFSSVQGLKGF